MEDKREQGTDIDEGTNRMQAYVDNLLGMEKCNEKFFLSLENYINWSFAACLATLLWFVGSFDKFMVNGELYNKYSFILAVILLLVSAFCFGIFRYVLYDHAIRQNRFLDNLGILPYAAQICKLRTGEKVYKPETDIIEHIATIKENLEDLSDFSDRWGGKRSCILDKLGIAFFLAGLMVVSFFIASLIFKIDEANVITSIIDRLR